MTVREVLDAARDAAMELRRIDEETQIRREAIGPQGYSMGCHSKSAILDPSRKIDELLDWELAQRSMPDITRPIDDAWEVVSGIATISDDMTVEVVSRYYLAAESWNSIAHDLSDRKIVDASLSLMEQVGVLQKSLEGSLDTWESVGIAHLKEMGREDEDKWRS